MVKIASPTDIYKAAAKLNLTQDEIQIMDDYAFQRLTYDEDTTAPQRLLLSRIHTIYFNYHYGKFEGTTNLNPIEYIEYIKQSGNTLVIIDDDPGKDFDQEIISKEALCALLINHFPLATWVSQENTAAAASTSRPLYTSSQFSTHQSQMQLPTHDPSTKKNFKPSSLDTPFRFTGVHKTKNQKMVTEKFCQYLTLTNQHLAIIPKLQDGICDALTHYAAQLTSDEWQTFIDRVQAWTGHHETMFHELQAQFEMLLTYIQQYQLRSNSEFSYLGDALENYLNRLPDGSVSIFHNPWHAITTKRLSRDSWWIYDPNWPEGPQIVPHSRIVQTIQSIGKIIAVEPSQVTLLPEINNPADFIRKGGLGMLALTQLNNAIETLQLIPDSAIDHFTNKDLEGIFLRNTSGIPAWVRGISNPLTAPLTRRLLTQYYLNNTPAFQAILQAGSCFTD